MFILSINFVSDIQHEGSEPYLSSFRLAALTACQIGKTPVLFGPTGMFLRPSVIIVSSGLARIQKSQTPER